MIYSLVATPGSYLDNIYIYYMRTVKLYIYLSYLLRKTCLTRNIGEPRQNYTTLLTPNPRNPTNFSELKMAELFHVQPSLEYSWFIKQTQTQYLILISFPCSVFSVHPILNKSYSNGRIHKIKSKANMCTIKGTNCSMYFTV